MIFNTVHLLKNNIKKQCQQYVDLQFFKFPQHLKKIFVHGWTYFQNKLQK